MIATRFNFPLPRTALAGAFLALAALLLFVIPEHSAGVAEAASKTKRACMKNGAVPEPKENPGLVADCVVLLKVKDTLRGDATLNWSSEVPIENWQGVRLENFYGRGRVVAVAPLQAGLNGTIPKGLSKLTNLKVLHLGNHRLTGKIPAELGSLPNLKELLLHKNRLKGRIPAELGNLENLRALHLHENRLRGRIPGELGDLRKLEALSLAKNRLTGSVPSELGKLSRLEYLSLEKNRLEGCVPLAIKNLPMLKDPEALLKSLGLSWCDE